MLPVDPGWADFSQRPKHSFSICRHTGATLTCNVSSVPKMYPFPFGIGWRIIVRLLERSLIVPEDTLCLVPEVGILKAALNVNIFNMIIGTIIIVFFPIPNISCLEGFTYIYTQL